MPFEAERIALERLRTDARSAPAATLPALQQWLTQARTLGDSGLIAQGLLVQSATLRTLDQRAQALASVAQAVMLAEACGDPRLLQEALLLQATLLDDEGLLAEALAAAERALELDAPLAPLDVAAARSVCGSLLARLGRVEQALAALGAAAEVEGQGEDDRVLRQLILIWHLADDLDRPTQARRAWLQLQRHLPGRQRPVHLRTAWKATELATVSPAGRPSAVVTAGRALLQAHAQSAHVATGWACAIALRQLVARGEWDAAGTWMELAAPLAPGWRSPDLLRWQEACADWHAQHGQATRARALRRAAARLREVHRPATPDPRHLLAQLRGLEWRLRLARGEQESARLRAEIRAQEARLQALGALPPSLLDELTGYRGQRPDALGTSDLAHLGFHLVYQPIVRIHPPGLAGFEALLRLEHPGRGPLSPAEFIPQLDRSGEIDTVGRWVLLEACRQLRRWQDRGLGAAVAVNVTASQLQGGGLSDFVDRALAHVGLAPQWLELEVTETVACADTGLVALSLDRLNALGVRISIDDFGTGYSNFGRLLDLTPSKVKIDRSLVIRLADSERATQAVHSLIQAAHGMAMRVTAEGVETPDQVARLARLGCDELQGYLLSRPLAAAALGPALALDGAGWQARMQGLPA